MNTSGICSLCAISLACLLAACGKPESHGFVNFGSQSPPPPPPLDVGKVGQAITEASGGAAGTTIASNVFNGSGKSCVEASETRGRAIADKLQTMKRGGGIPADHSVEVHTYSGYRVPFMDYTSLHTYTVTQVKDKTGRAVHTWTTDNYLGPNNVTHYPGDGGYKDWKTDVMTGDVKPTNPDPVIKPFPSLGDSHGGGGGGGGGGGRGH